MVGSSPGTEKSIPDVLLVQYLLQRLDDIFISRYRHARRAIKAGNGYLAGSSSAQLVDGLLNSGCRCPDSYHGAGLALLFLSQITGQPTAVICHRDGILK